VVPAAGAPLLPAIANPGIKVGHRALTSLKTVAFLAHHLIRTSRPLDLPATALTPAILANLHGLKEAQDAYTHPPVIPTLDKIKQIQGHIEDIDAQLLKMLGMVKASLAYITREDVIVLAHNTDPSNNYNTVQEEMVAHMPHAILTRPTVKITLQYGTSYVTRSTIQRHSCGLNDVKGAVTDVRPIWPSPLTTWVMLRMKP
jgi:hypothetical protein